MGKSVNKIISIGVLGNQTCYLNISEEEAITRYCEKNKIVREDFWYAVKSFEFADEFGAYDIDEKGGFYN